MRRWVGGVLALVVLLAMVAGCGKTEPKTGVTLDATVVQKGEGISISVKTTGFQVPKDGHIHISVDGGPQAMAYSNTYTIPKVAPGVHKVEVGLSDMQHNDLGVSQTKEIEVK
ncbi:MAG TPA: hypothetical protein VK464_14745 [Symbiobacteriaceae bacterium]|jgi:hypothetical protein|nr:hypothetical protein [Symbiobacteriaceae bacterium]